MLFYRYLVLLQLQVKNLRFTMWLLYYFAVLQLQFKFQIVLVSLYFWLCCSCSYFSIRQKKFCWLHYRH